MMGARHLHWRLDGHAKQSGNEALVCDGARSHLLAASSMFASFSEARQGSTLAVVTPGRRRAEKSMLDGQGLVVNCTAQDQGS